MYDDYNENKSLKLKIGQSFKGNNELPSFILNYTTFIHFCLRLQHSGVLCYKVKEIKKLRI